MRTRFKIQTILGLAIVSLFSNVVLGDVRSVPRIRIPEEHRVAAVSGEEYQGVIEFTAPDDVVLDQIDFFGEGWDVRSVTPSASVELRRGQPILIRFRAIPTDADVGVKPVMAGTRITKRNEPLTYAKLPRIVRTSGLPDIPMASASAQPTPRHAQPNTKSAPSTSA